MEIEACQNFGDYRDCVEWGAAVISKIWCWISQLSLNILQASLNLWSFVGQINKTKIGLSRQIHRKLFALLKTSQDSFVHFEPSRIILTKISLQIYRNSLKCQTKSIKCCHKLFENLHKLSFVQLMRRELESWWNLSRIIHQ